MDAKGNQLEETKITSVQSLEYLTRASNETQSLVFE